jgi:hypothetical protein
MMSMPIVNRLLAKSRALPKTQLRNVATALKQAARPELKAAEDGFQKTLRQPAKAPVMPKQPPALTALERRILKLFGPMPQSSLKALSATN